MNVGTQETALVKQWRVAGVLDGCAAYVCVANQGRARKWSVNRGSRACHVPEYVPNEQADKVWCIIHVFQIHAPREYVVLILYYFLRIFVSVVDVVLRPWVDFTL